MKLEDEPKFKKWKSTLEKSGCIIKGYDSLQVIYKKNDELLFAMLRTEITTPEGNALPPIVVIRGDVVVIVPKVRNRATGQERFVMVRQDRIGNGRRTLEFPAGMLDRNIGDPAAVAVDEMAEETGLTVNKKDLFPLSDKALYTSPGLDDEAVYYFGCVIELTDEAYRALEGNKTGAIEEGEKIIVTLKTAEEIMRETNAAQVVLGLFLFNAAPTTNSPQAPRAPTSRLS
jgi:ADP-sugar diphosphatase